MTPAPPPSSQSRLNSATQFSVLDSVSQGRPRSKTAKEDKVFSTMSAAQQALSKLLSLYHSNKRSFEHILLYHCEVFNTK